MHEAGVLYRILEEAQHIAAENEADEVYEIVLQIGELSACIPMYMQHYFPMLTENKPKLKNAKLTVEVIPGIVRCLDCGTEYDLLEQEGYCPACRSFDKMVVSGKELVIKEISTR